MTKEEVLAELGQIDKKHYGLTEGLSRAPAEFQESRSGDDDATEDERTSQKLGETRRELEELESRRDALHKRLAELDKAA